MVPVTRNMLVAPSGPNPPITRVARVVRVEPQVNLVWLAFPGLQLLPKKYDLARFRAALDAGRICSIADVTQSSVLGYSDATETTKSRCEEAMQSIAHVLANEDEFFDEERRPPLMREQATMSGVNVSTVYRNVARYYAGGSTKLALVPKYRSVKPGDNQPEGQKRRGRPPRQQPPEGHSAFIFDDESRDKILALLMKSRKFATFEALYADVTWSLFSHEVDGKRERLPGHQMPTRDQIRYLVKQFDKGFAFTRRQMGNEFNLTIRPIEGKARARAFGAGHEYQVDATGSQTQLVKIYDRTSRVGAAWVYFVVDIATSMICGFHVTLKSPSWEAARFALFHAFSPKAESCRRMGLDIAEKDWPVSGLPSRILGDRGELVCSQSERIVDDILNCTMVNARTRRGEDKPYVERLFRSLKTSLLASLDGYRPKQRLHDGVDPKKHACLDIYQLNKLVAQFCLHWNHKRLDVGAIPDWVLGVKDLKVTPMALWAYSLREHVGQLRSVDSQLLYQHLLPQAEAPMRRDGIHFRGDVYSAEELDDLGLRVRAGRRGSCTVKVHFDEARADHIWLWLPDLNRMIECKRTDRLGDRSQWSFVDAEAAEQDKKALRAKEATETENLRTGLEDARRTMQELARQQKKAAGASPVGNTQTMRRNRKAEQQLDDQRVRENAGQPPPGPPVISPPRKKKAAPAYSQTEDEFLDAAA